MTDTASISSGIPWRPWRWALHWQILLALVLGSGVGYLLGLWAVGAATGAAVSGGDSISSLAVSQVKASWLYLMADLVGDLFIAGLRVIIVPLVTTSIILAVAGLGAGRGFGRLGGKTLLYYLTTTLAAILIGLTLVNLVQPGVNHEGRGILQGRDLAAFADVQRVVESRPGGRQATDFLDVFREMIPSNIIEAAAGDRLLGLITVSLVVGFFLARSTGPARDTLLRFVQGVYDLTLRVTDLVLQLAPVGVLGLIMATVAEQYAKLAPDQRFGDFVTGIALFACVALGALLLHLLGTMPLILAGIARVNPLRHYRAMAPALITAFSTASSSATLPLTMDCVEKRAGVSNRVTSFVLPLGATVNMDGTALYECVAAIFICQAFGVHLGFAQQFMIVLAALLTSIGVAGVPAASLVAIIIILQAVQHGLPAGVLPDGVLLTGGLGLLFVFDRPLDMVRTAVNIFSDSVGAVTIARSEGESVLAS